MTFLTTKKVLAGIPPVFTIKNDKAGTFTDFSLDKKRRQSVFRMPAAYERGTSVSIIMEAYDPP